MPQVPADPDTKEPIPDAVSTGTWTPPGGSSTGSFTPQGGSSSSTMQTAFLGRQPYNVLMVVIDDLGVEQLKVYDSAGVLSNDINRWTGTYPYAPTPTLNALAQRGVVFNRAYAAPICSPTRASILTGQRVHKHRLGFAVNQGETYTLGDVVGGSAPLVRVLRSLESGDDTFDTVRCAARGKWHLGAGYDEPLSPREAGYFENYRGKLENANVLGIEGGGAESWMSNWTKTIVTSAGTSTQQTGNSQHIAVNEYLDARTFIQARVADEEPFFLYYASHLAHGPFNGAWIDHTLTEPESSGAYHSYGAEPGSPEGVDVVRMMTESLDTMIAGLLSALGTGTVADDTLVIVVGDNGTDPVAINPAFSPSVTGAGTYNPPDGSGNYEYIFERFKQSVYERGINVPLIIAPARPTANTNITIASPGRASNALVEACDLYPTVTQALGLRSEEPNPIDGRSLFPILEDASAVQVREYGYMQRHAPLGAVPADYTESRHAVMNQAGWKLIDNDGTRELYDLDTDPAEHDDLYDDAGAEAVANRAELEAELTRVLAEVT